MLAVHNPPAYCILASNRDWWGRVTRRDHLEGIGRPHAKFGTGPLKTVAVCKKNREQTGRQIHRHAQTTLNLQQLAAYATHSDAA